MKRVTIKEVAEKSNTSIRTVSRVINNHPHVKKETREKVKKVIEELNFEVNMVARTLRHQRTNLIVVFIDNRNGMYWGTYHNDLFNELYWVARKKGFRMVISPSSHESFEEDENDGFNLIKHGLCDGAIIFDPSINDKRIYYLNEADIPFIVIGKEAKNDNSSFVGIDNEEAGYIGAKHLQNKGYNRLALLLGNKNSIVNRSRAVGFERLCKEKKVFHKILYENSNLESIYKNSSTLLQEDKIDGFFVSGDERALGVYRAIVENNLEVGKDIGVIGIDNLLVGDYMTPSLSSIASPKKEIASNVINILADKIDANNENIFRTLFSPLIVQRNSTIRDNQ